MSRYDVVHVILRSVVLILGKDVGLGEHIALQSLACVSPAALGCWVLLNLVGNMT